MCWAVVRCSGFRPESGSGGQQRGGSATRCKDKTPYSEPKRYRASICSIHCSMLSITRFIFYTIDTRCFMNIVHRSIAHFFLVALCVVASMAAGVGQSTALAQVEQPDCRSSTACFTVGILNATDIVRSVRLLICCEGFSYNSPPIAVMPQSTVFWSAPENCRIIGIQSVTPIPPNAATFLWTGGKGCMIQIY